MRILFVYSLILLLLGMGASHFIFMGYLKSQKNSFRSLAIQSNLKEVKQIRMNPSLLYKDQRGMQWKEKGKELVVEGIYHEVLNIVSAGPYAIIYLIEDKAENDLFGSYFALREKKAGSLSGHLISLMVLLYWQGTTLLLLLPGSSGSSYYLFFQKFFTSPFHSRLLKPPAY